MRRYFAHLFRASLSVWCIRRYVPRHLLWHHLFLSIHPTFHLKEWYDESRHFYRYFYATSERGCENVRAVNTIFSERKIAYSVFAPQHTAEDNFVANVNKMRSIPLTILYPECRFSFPTPRIRRELLSFKPDMIHIATPFNMGLCGLYYAKS